MSFVSSFYCFFYSTLYTTVLLIKGLKTNRQPFSEYTVYFYTTEFYFLEYSDHLYICVPVCSSAASQSFLVYKELIKLVFVL